MSHQPTNTQVTALQLLQESNNPCFKKHFPQGAQPTKEKRNLSELWDVKPSTMNVMAEKGRRVRKRVLPKAQRSTKQVKTPSRKRQRKNKRKKTPYVVPDTPPREIPGGNLSAELEKDHLDMKHKQVEQDNQELEPDLIIKKPIERVASIHPHHEYPANQQEYMVDQELYGDIDRQEAILFNIREAQREVNDHVYEALGMEKENKRFPRKWLIEGGLHVPSLTDELSDVLWWGQQLSSEAPGHPVYEHLKETFEKARQHTQFYTFAQLALMFPAPAKN